MRATFAWRLGIPVAALALVCGVVGSATVAAAQSSKTASGVVAMAADDVVLSDIAAEKLNPVRASRLLGYVSAAMALSASDRAVSELAVASAARTVVDGLLPARVGSLNDLVTSTQDALAGQGLRSRDLDIATSWGSGIGRGLLVRAAHDGADANVAPPPPQFVGAWVPTPPGYLPRLEPAAGSWRTWWLTGGDQFRPAPPLRPGDAGYAAQVQEVYDVSRALTPAQRAIAEYWADGPGTVTPPGH